jgi:hypothetical protein
VFFRNRPQVETPWRARIAPRIAFVVLTLVLLATTIGLGDLLQLEDDSVFQWFFQSLYMVVAALGVGWALYLRRNRPEVFTAIGHGGRA